MILAIAIIGLVASIAAIIIAYSSKRNSDVLITAMFLYLFIAAITILAWWALFPSIGIIVCVGAVTVLTSMIIDLS